MSDGHGAHMSLAHMSLAHMAMALLAVDPVGIGGVTVRARASPFRDAWLSQLRTLLPPGAPWRRVPPGIAESRLLGGLDLPATLVAGRPVLEHGLLAQANGGLIIVPMAERLSTAVVGPLCAVLDTGVVALERDGLALRIASGFGVVLLDEGIGDERAPAALMERLACILDLDDAPTDAAPTLTREAIAAAQARLGAVEIGADLLQALCEIGLAFGVGSLRIASAALRISKAAAALDGRKTVDANDLALAAALAIAPRATVLPSNEREAPEDQNQDEMPDPGTEPPSGDEQADESELDTVGNLTDRLVEAAKAAIPAGLLAALGDAAGGSKGEARMGRAGVPRQAQHRGRPAGVRHGSPGQGGRLAIVETLRAAAPWQTIRRKGADLRHRRILVRPEDFRVARFKQRSETTTIFVVDASGSAALNRLAEVKGAVELILAECYVRRDSVALIAFRGTSAELILPPTRSLARAKRALAGQPGGGGTPLATAIDATALLALAVRRKGPTPLAVFLTDGRANIGRAGRPGRAEAEADALNAARAACAGALASLLIDISPRPNAAAQRLALALGARYQPLPYVDSRLLSQAVLAASEPVGPRSR